MDFRDVAFKPCKVTADMLAVGKVKLIIRKGYNELEASGERLKPNILTIAYDPETCMSMAILLSFRSFLVSFFLCENNIVFASIHMNFPNYYYIIDGKKQADW